jgi:hypothetical protein
MTQELEATPSRDKLLTTELVPEQVLPKVMTTFGLTATYVFIICWITGSSIMAAGGGRLDGYPDVGAGHTHIPGASGHGGRGVGQPVAR